jgi:hypothetical protein
MGLEWEAKEKEIKNKKKSRNDDLIKFRTNWIGLEFFFVKQNIKIEF